jgi:hypothetical protein
MGWIDTLSREAFQLAVREAVKPDLESLRADSKEDFQILRADIRDLNKRLGDLEQRVSRLEGTIEGTMRAYEANLARMFAEFQRNIERDLFTRLLEDRGKSAA